MLKYEELKVKDSVRSKSKILVCPVS